MTQTRTANKQNEITSISGAGTPTYDSNGNMLTDETGKQFVYDAWNRLVAVKSSGGILLQSYKYDARGYRIAEVPGTGSTTDLYYSAGWQVLEERVGGTAAKSYVWSPVYIDAMIARDRDTDANGSLDERLYVLHDANFNVTGLVNTSGSVVERYTYDPFGTATVRDSSWTAGTSGYAWVYMHQEGRLNAMSGLHYFRNRDYSATLGRWVTMDPIGYHSNEMNLFRYVQNNPVFYLDPTGLVSTLQGCLQSPASFRVCIDTGVIAVRDVVKHIGTKQKDIIKFLEKMGGREVCGGKGSHKKVRMPSGRTETVPENPGIGTLDKIVKRVLDEIR